MRPLTLQDATVMVTGASSGLGVEFAHRLAARGADLVLVARRADRLAEVAAQIGSAHGVTVTTITMDLVRDDAGAALREELSRRGITLTGLVNNAGFGLSGALHQVEPARVREMVRLNVDSLVDVTTTFLPELRASGRGILVNVASLAAFQPNPGLAAYGASKAFVLNFTEALWEESRAAGLRALALCPGPAKTEFFEVAGDAAGAGLPKMEPGAVVESALKALERRNPPAAVVPGVANTAMSQLAKRLLPTRFVAGTVGAMMRRGQSGGEQSGDKQGGDGQGGGGRG
jgi:short-subunit dehydrogenase